MVDPTKYKLDPDELETLYKEILLDYLRDCASQKEPTLGVIAAQTAAGKSALYAIIKSGFKPDEKPVHVDMDEFREYNTNLSVIFIEHPFETAFYTNEDAWTWTSGVLDEAKKLRFNVLYETALKSIDGIEETIKSYKEEGYAVVLHTLAINSKHSSYGVFARYEEALRQNRPARFVDIAYHDASSDLLPVHVDRLEKSTLLDSLSVWRRAGWAVCEKIYKNDGTYPDQTAKEVMEIERNRIWTTEEKQDYLNNWRKLVKQIDARTDGPTKPDWYVKAAKRFLREAWLFSKSEQANDKHVFEPDQIIAASHHHIFTRDENHQLICFDRQKYQSLIAPERGKIYAPPKVKPSPVLR